jgi:serpin B
MFLSKAKAKGLGLEKRVSMRLLLVLAVIILFLILEGGKRSYAEEGEEKSPDSQKAGPGRGPEAPAPSRELLARATGNTEFALSLYKSLATEKGDIFLSPFSVSAAMAMVYAGASGDTAKEIGETLRFEGDALTTLKAFGELDELFTKTASEEEGLRRGLKDSLWLQKGENFLGSFINILGERLKASVFHTDFKGDGAKAKEEINDWALKATDGLIETLLSEPPSDRTRLMLLDAVYFKGAWKEAFDPKRNYDDDFVYFDGKKVRIIYMMRTSEYSYYETLREQVLEIPYKGDKISLMLVIPTETGEEAFRKLEESLSAESIRAYAENLSVQDVVVTLPRFGISWGAKSLREIFQKLGLNAPFAANADFSAITGDKSLQISDVLHKAYVDVNEEGTEAAAVTSVPLAFRSFHPMPQFSGKRPFLFLIREKTTGSVLFMGRLTEPKA